MTVLEVDMEINKWMEHYKEKLGLEHVLRGPDCKGHAAGVAYFHRNEVRFNVGMFAYNGNYKAIKETVGHELAHIAVRQKYQSHTHIKPHGPEWKAEMRRIDLPPDRTHALEIPPSQKQWRQKFQYECPTCGEIFWLGKKRHTNAQRGLRWYLCSDCPKKILVWTGKTERR